MLAFPSFPKELMFDLEEDDEAKAGATGSTPIQPATREKVTQGQEGDEEKTKSISIGFDHEVEETNPTFASHADTIAPIPP